MRRTGRRGAWAVAAAVAAVVLLAAACGEGRELRVVHARLADAALPPDARVASRALGDDVHFVRSVAQALPARLEWRVTLPAGAPELVLRAAVEGPRGSASAAARLRVSLRSEAAGAEPVDAWETRVGAGPVRRQIDLAAFAGREVALVLEAAGPAGGEVVWGNARVRVRRRTTQPHVVLVCVDTLRRDHVDGFGGGRGLTPEIGRLAADGVVFERAVASSPWTLPSVATVLTGLRPSVHGAGRRVTLRRGATYEEFERLLEEGSFARFLEGEIYRPSRLGSGAETLAELLGGPYATHAVNANVNLSPVGNVLTQGFDSFVYESLFPGDRLTQRALDLAGAHRDGLLFLYVHYMEPHQWEWREPDGSRRERPVRKPGESQAIYARLVRDADRHVGALLDGLRRLDLYEEALVVLFSDHGEHFWDDRSGRRIGHGHTVHNVLVRVPLVVKLPGGAYAGTRVEDTVKLADVFRTVLEEAQLSDGSPLPPDLVSLRRAAAEGVPERTIVSEFNVEGPELVAVERGSLKLVHAPGRGYWSLRHADTDLDGGLLAPAQRAEEDRLRTLLEEHLRRREETAIPPPMQMNPEALEQLRRLGYVP